jgi:hypothetical protein
VCLAAGAMGMLQGGAWATLELSQVRSNPLRGWVPVPTKV